MAGRNTASDGRQAEGTVQESLNLNAAVTQESKNKTTNTTREPRLLVGEDGYKPKEYMFRFQDNTATPMPTRAWKLKSMNVDEAGINELTNKTEKKVGIAGKSKTKLVTVVTSNPAPGVRAPKNKDGTRDATATGKKFAVAVPASASRLEILWFFTNKCDGIVGVSMGGRIISTVSAP
jgi:hypothetical protein